MSRLFEELDYQKTPIGALSLRRRHDMALGKEVFEIKLGEEFLMTSLVAESEIALARLGLEMLDGSGLTVCVGGLGLGFTAAAVLEDRRVESLTVVEFLRPVIDWHERGLLPLGDALTGDGRCRFIEGDFFAMAAGPDPLDPAGAGRAFDAILVDIDHSPDALLDARSQAFYGPDGLARLAAQLGPGGVFGLWSNDVPDPAFTERLSGVFALAKAEPVRIDSPYGGPSITQTVYLARAEG